MKDLKDSEGSQNKPDEVSDGKVWHGCKQDISPEIKKCLEANGFVEDDGVYLKCVSELCNIEAVNIIGDVMFSEVLISNNARYRRTTFCAINFTKKSDWNFLCDKIDLFERYLKTVA